MGLGQGGLPAEPDHLSQSGTTRPWKIRWNELCPFHKNTGFTLTLFEKVPRTQNSDKKIQESGLFSRAKFNPATGVRWGWVFLEQTWILSGIQFTTRFIDFFVVETKSTWPKSEPFWGVFWIGRFSTFGSKTHFPETQKSWPEALWELARWVWFRIPQNIPNVWARRVAKTAARFYHSKFETTPPWLMCHFKAFLAQWIRW